MDISHLLLLAAMLLGAYFLYLLFTQPNNALWLAERVLTVIIKFLYYLALGIMRIFSAIVALFRRWFGR